MSSRKPTRIAVVFGTRPEAIKLAPVVHGLNHDPRFVCRVIVTGQHREMLQQTLETVGVKPQVDLKLMRRDQSLTSFVAQALLRLETEFRQWKPDAVLVQGDTGSTLAGALAAFYQKIPVGHVEAGLRSFDREHPFPEEINRCMVSRVATWHFAPTALAAKHLQAEGISPKSIFITGNTVVDALQGLVTRRGDRRSPSNNKNAAPVVVTAHRRENIGQPLYELCQAVGALARRHPEREWIFPVHPNPAVRRQVKAGLAPLPSNVRLCPPMDYPEFLRILAQAALVITDSGGVQEEATVFGVPILIMRKTTERPEVLQAGGHLAPANRRALIALAERLLQQPANPRRVHSPFGDGRATERIVQALAWGLGRQATRPKHFRTKGGG